MPGEREGTIIRREENQKTRPILPFMRVEERRALLGGSMGGGLMRGEGERDTAVPP